MDITLALSGFGNVGQGVAKLLADHGLDYQTRYGVRLVLTGVADRGGAAVRPEGLDPVDLLRAKAEHGTVAASRDGSAGLTGAHFLNRATAQVLIEAASTNFEDAEPGWSYACNAIAKGMDLVLASKGVLVLHYRELMEEARRCERVVKFGAAVGAPLPVLELAERALVGTQIRAFEGVVNSTTNLILESMSEGANYQAGLKAAQDAGVAETDPTLDVDGWDAAAKTVIIARALWDVDIRLQDVDCQGIRGVSWQDLEEARVRGEAIKFVSSAVRKGDSVQARVAPESRSLTDPLGRLRGISVGIILNTDMLGAVAISVQDSGGMPTALTVVRDVINLARDRDGRVHAPS